MRFSKSWGKENCFSTLIQFIVVLILLVLLTACMSLALLMEAGVNSPAGRTLAFAMIIGTAAAAMAGAIAMLVWRRHRQNRWLDDAFLPQGLARGRSFLLGREYHGVSGSRQVNAYINRGPILQLYLSTSVRTRLTASPLGRIGRWGIRLANENVMEIERPGSRKVFLQASDEAWARLLIADPRAEEAILRLCSPEDRWQIGYLSFHPGDIMLTMYRVAFGNITSDAVRSWLQDLAALSESAERLRPPAPVRALSPLERAARDNRRTIELLVMGIVLALLFLAAACITVMILMTALP